MGNRGVMSQIVQEIWMDCVDPLIHDPLTDD